MPTFSFGALPDDPRKIERVRLKLSSELKNEGKASMKDIKTGITPTDESILLAQLIAPQILSSAYTMATPPVENQGSEGCCVSFAIGYYQRSIKEYYFKGASSFATNTNIFSPEYLYNYTKASSLCNAGSAAITTYDFLVNKGCCLWATLPYTAGSCDVSTAMPFDAAAANFRIQSYATILAADRTAIKTSLTNNNPLVISFNVDTAFYNAGSSFIWNATNHASSPSQNLGRHAVTIIGYDDTKSAYKIINQWGTGWGDAGFSWIDYDFFEAYVAYNTYSIEGVVSTGITPTLPTANAGFDTTIPSTATASLDGSASSDPDGYIASYLWTQESGAAVTINNSTTAVASVDTWAGAGAYVFKLVVTDNDGNTAFDTVTINVTVVAVPADAIVLSGVKSVKRGKVSDVLTWQISLAEPFQIALLQISATTLVGFNPLYLISVPNASYTNIPPNSKKFRYYRVQVLKSDNTYACSNEVALK